MATIKDFMIEHPKDLPCGFISPKGEFFHAPYLQHSALAEEICDWFGYEGKDALTTLEDNGWVHITVTTFIEHGLHIMIIKDFLTEEQKICLRPLLENPPMQLTKISKKWLSREFPDIEFEAAS